MKNYTSGVPAERTISKIEQILAQAGVWSVHKEYSEGMVHAVSFSLPTPNGNVTVRLPANAPAIERIFLGGYKQKPSEESKRKCREQATRTAWKLMLDWLEVQLSLIEMQQVEALQVFLPYLWDGKTTAYAALMDSGFKMLPQKSGAK